MDKSNDLLEINNTIETEPQTFGDFSLHPLVEDGIEAMNFHTPSPVQIKTIPLILGGRDVISCAQTGTGKTAAFLLPILSELATGEYPEAYVNAIVMTPTRELAQQIDRQIDAFSYFVGVSAVSIYGGTGGSDWIQQKKALELGADMIVATPGRLLALMNMSNVDFSRTSFFVLDEADRMLDMGFYEDIVEIYKQLPKDVQVVMFSATMPPKIRLLAKQIMKNPAEVNIAVSRPPKSIRQEVVYCKAEEKLYRLTELLSTERPQKCIVFFSSKERVKQSRRNLQMQGLKVQEMHSDLDQSQRDETICNFKAGNTHIIVATDIISRGIDIDDVNLVINFDVPSDPEDYVHRIGRTARGTQQKGAAITFVSPRDQERFETIERFLEYEITRHPSSAEKTSVEHLKSDNGYTKEKRGRRYHNKKKGKARAESPQHSSKPSRKGRDSISFRQNNNKESNIKR